MQCWRWVLEVVGDDGKLPRGLRPAQKLGRGMDRCEAHMCVVWLGGAC